jgi:acyl-homoserine lactone acylase PvdQ
VKSLLLILATAAAVSTPSSGYAQDLARWQRQAQNVTIIRDDWGIAHVYGRSDADAVFGMIYAQAENREHGFVQVPGSMFFSQPGALRAGESRSPW